MHDERERVKWLAVEGREPGKVFLRPVREADLGLVLGWWNDPQHLHCLGRETPLTLAELRERFRARPSATPHEDWFAVCLPEADRPVGVVVLLPRSPQPELLALVALVIDPAERRKGLGRQTLAQVGAWTAAQYPGVKPGLRLPAEAQTVRAFFEACGYQSSPTGMLVLEPCDTSGARPC